MPGRHSWDDDEDGGSVAIKTALDGLMTSALSSVAASAKRSAPARSRREWEPRPAPRRRSRRPSSPFAVLVWSPWSQTYTASASSHDSYGEAEAAAAARHLEEYGDGFPRPRDPRFVPVDTDRYEAQYGDLPESE